jgi:protein-disulfide isomerase
MLNFSNIHATEYLSVVSIFLIVFVFILVLIPALQKEKSTRLLTMELQRIKYNPQIIDTLLLKEKQIELPQDFLTIQKGNPNGKIKLLKVCSPFCNPCSKAHIVLEELLANNDELDLKLIFTATENEDDPLREPVMHFLAISQIDQSDLTKRALDDWYLAPEKNYKSFAEKYPIENELFASQIKKIKLMNEWCESVKVLATPTLFINGHELPAMYSVSDLKYYFNV